MRLLVGFLVFLLQMLFAPLVCAQAQDDRILVGLIFVPNMTLEQVSNCKSVAQFMLEDGGKSAPAGYKFDEKSHLASRNIWMEAERRLLGVPSGARLVNGESKVRSELESPFDLLNPKNALESADWFRACNQVSGGVKRAVRISSDKRLESLYTDQLRAEINNLSSKYRKRGVDRVLSCSAFTIVSWSAELNNMSERDKVSALGWMKAFSTMVESGKINPTKLADQNDFWRVLASSGSKNIALAPDWPSQRECFQ